jgi:hypothetical protein
MSAAVLPDARAREILLENMAAKPWDGKAGGDFWRCALVTTDEALAAMAAFAKEASPPASDPAIPAGEDGKQAFRSGAAWAVSFQAVRGRAPDLNDVDAAFAAAAPKVAVPARHSCGCEADPIDGLDYVCDRHLREGGSPLAAAPKVASECPTSPDGRHQVDTSMEEGPNNCFHCSAKMGTNDAR